MKASYCAALADTTISSLARLDIFRSIYLFREREIGDGVIPTDTDTCLQPHHLERIAVAVAATTHTD